MSTQFLALNQCVPGLPGCSAPIRLFDVDLVRVDSVASGFTGFFRRIHPGQIVIPQVPDIESVFRTALAKWLRSGFPGEKARR
jgi:hypothetical protein